MDANSGSFHVEAVLGNAGIANSRQVWSDNSELVRELWNQGPPHPRGLGVAMEKDHRGPVAGGEIVNLDPIDFAEPGCDRIGSGFGLAQRCNRRGKEKYKKHSCS